jgi:serine kinase of HPr protein (carbohydrate metabolism regulator)
MRAYGLNSVVMLCYAFASAPLDTCLIHASLVRNDGVGYAFTAKSGTGKSTQVSNWLRYIPGSDLMNDDNPVVRIIDGKAYIYGSPWSGKTPCYRNIKAPLGGIALIKRAQSNSLERLRPIDAFITLLPACSTMKWDERIYRCNGDTVTKMIETTPVYNLHCLPDKESAVVASTGMKAGSLESKG